MSPSYFIFHVQNFSYQNFEISGSAIGHAIPMHRVRVVLCLLTNLTIGTFSDNE